MNKKQRKRKKKKAKEKFRAANPQVMLTEAKSANDKPAKESAGKEDDAETLQQQSVSLMGRFKNWITTVTVAEVVTVLLTATIAVTTIHYTGYSKKQWQTMERQLDGMKKDQRPWMKVRTQILAPIPKQGTAVTLGVTVANTGKTPAKGVDAKFYIEKVRNGEEPQLSNAAQVASYTTGVLFPNEFNPPSPISYPFLNKSEFEDFKEARLFLVIYGRAGYKDFFGTSHWTDFCEFAGNPGKPAAYSARKCTDYSNTDDN